MLVFRQTSGNTEQGAGVAVRHFQQLAELSLHLWQTKRTCQRIDDQRQRSPQFVTGAGEEVDALLGQFLCLPADPVLFLHVTVEDDDRCQQQQDDNCGENDDRALALCSADIGVNLVVDCIEVFALFLYLLVLHGDDLRVLGRYHR